MVALIIMCYWQAVAFTFRLRPHLSLYLQVVAHSIFIWKLAYINNGTPRKGGAGFQNSIFMPMCRLSSILWVPRFL